MTDTHRSALMVAVMASCVVGCSAPLELDLLIRNGRVVDGTGNPWRSADVGIRGDRIIAVGPLPERTRAKRTIDAAGLVVAPGFIDVLSQSELSLLLDGRQTSKVTQGITTEVMGENHSAGPVVGQVARDTAGGVLSRFGLELTWTTLGGFFERVERTGPSINVASYVGAGQLRENVLGHAAREATTGELEEMKWLLAVAMRDGALGLSSALIYVPGRYATTEELIGLAEVAAAHGGIYTSHVRGEGHQLLEAIDEAIRIGSAADIPVEIFHLKASRPPSWPLLPRAIARIEAARAEGIDIAGDIYPYTAAATGLDVLFPSWAREQGNERLLELLADPTSRARIHAGLAEEAREYGGKEQFGDSILIARLFPDRRSPWDGKTIRQVAEETHKDAYDALMDLFATSEGRGAGIYFVMSEENVELKMTRPWLSFCTDAGAIEPNGPLSANSPHPRAYGAFPRVLGRYVREKRLLRLEEAVRRMTSLPAGRLGLEKRGLLQPGYFADIVVFDPARVTDNATYSDPHALSSGILHVLVNGKVVIENQTHTGRRPGRVLRRSSRDVR